MSVGKGIVDRFAIPARFYQMLFLQNAQLMGNRTLCHGQTVRNITDTQLSIRECI